MSVIQIKEYERLAPLLSSQIRRGVLTNALLGADDYRREIASGSLWVHEWDGGLLLFRRRGDAWRMNFYLHGTDCPPRFAADGPVVLEIALRPRDTGLRQAIDFWQREGFDLAFWRVRLALSTPVDLPSGPFPVRTALRDERERVREILTSCFDPLTGCLPTENELERDLSGGNFLLALSQDGSTAGLLHMQAERQSTQLRHLAVAEEFRGQGAGQSLLAEYLRRERGRSLVWVREDNATARRLYEKNGYRPDEWTSAVLYRL